MSITEDRVERQVYELGYLILPSIAEESLSDVVDTLKGIIKKIGGEEIASENPLHMELAYTMSKTIGARKYVVDEAYIGWIKFETEPVRIAEVNEEVKKLDEVLRFLITKAPRETVFTFAAAMQAKEDKEKEKQEALVEVDKAKDASPEAVVE